MTAIHSARTTLLANALEWASAACFTVSIAFFVAGYVYNVADLRRGLPGLVLALDVAGWFVGAR